VRPYDVNAEGTSLATVTELPLRTALNRSLMELTHMVVCRACCQPTPEEDAFPCEQAGLDDGGGYECRNCVWDFTDDLFTPEPAPSTSIKGISSPVEAH
jgi:hypothetical protein